MFPTSEIRDRIEDRRPEEQQTRARWRETVAVGIEIKEVEAGLGLRVC
jgi:hypothetical protein